MNKDRLNDSKFDGGLVLQYRSFVLNEGAFFGNQNESKGEESFG